LLGVKRSIEANESINKDKRRKKKEEKRKVREKMQIKHLSRLQRFLTTTVKKILNVQFFLVWDKSVAL
jgi:ubiquitin C-terminal hydrolase